jgi:hypothetical protein
MRRCDSLPTHSFDLKDEQITRILCTPTLIRGSEGNERTRIPDVKGEIVAECCDMFDQLQDEFGQSRSSFEKRQHKTEQTLQSIQSRQTECTISHAELASRVDQNDDERDMLKGEFLLIKNDFKSECVS